MKGNPLNIQENPSEHLHLQTTLENLWNPYEHLQNQLTIKETSADSSKDSNKDSSTDFSTDPKEHRLRALRS